ncbi:MAG TPA: PIN domain-containing protein [Candidatus Aquilonibacter sp.]|nr:PIN domain-containing protein [Candidatus Aquilonibacter sp.]
MGVVLDSSVLIAGERRRESVREILERVRAAQGEVDCALSVVTVVELTHGIYRAKTDVDRDRRRAFSEELRRDMVVHPVTIEIAELAGRIEGEQAARGVSISFEDLLIGTTALHLGYAIATSNVRDFQKIPGLSVTQV